MKLRHYPIVLGIPWLRQHDVCLHFAQNEVIFDSSYCLSHCLDNSLYVQGTIQDPPTQQLDSIARPCSHTVLEVQKTQKVVPLEYYDFLLLFMDKE
jgi:hypothetical protein